jgi:hypothetical protein
MESNQNLVKILDIVLFKGKSHSKRSDSITLFPIKIQRQLFDEIDITKEIKDIFVDKFTLLEKE